MENGANSSGNADNANNKTNNNANKNASTEINSTKTSGSADTTNGKGKQDIGIKNTNNVKGSNSNVSTSRYNGPHKRKKTNNTKENKNDGRTNKAKRIIPNQEENNNGTISEEILPKFYSNSSVGEDETEQNNGNIVGNGVEKTGEGIEKAGKGIEKTGKGIKNAGKGIENTGKGVKYTGKGMQVAGKGMQAGGKAVSAAGKSVSAAGKALSSTGVGAVVGAPLMAAGTLVDGAGKGTEMAGKGVETAGKGVEKTGKGIEKTGKSVKNTGENIESTGEKVRDFGNTTKDTGKNINNPSRMLLPGERMKSLKKTPPTLNNNPQNPKYTHGDKSLSKKNDEAEIKKKRKAIIKKIILHSIIPLILFILAAAVVMQILGVLDKVGTAVANLTQTIVDFFETEDDGAIIVNNDKIDTIINGIAAEQVNVRDLKLLGDYASDASDEEKQEAQRKYIRKFYEAQAVTETLNYNLGQDENKTYGAVYVYRLSEGATSTDLTDEEKEEHQLTYMPYEEMLAYTTRTDKQAAEEIRKYFSIDENGYLVYAATSEVTVSTGSGPGITVSSITLRSVDYKKAIAQYTTKMNFLIYLTMISQNPEFVAALTDIIKDSRIEITLMDNVSTNVKTETHNYVQHNRVVTENETPTGATVPIERETSENVTSVTQTTTVMHNPTAKVTYVKTWFCEQKITYNNVVKDPVEDEYVHNSENDDSLKDEDPPPEGESGSWKTDQEIIYNEVTNTNVFEEGVRGDVDFSVLGQKGDNVRYANGEIEEPTFVGLLDTEFDLPLSTRVMSPGSNVVSGSGILFELLQKDPDLEHLEEILRYALYLYTGKDYGVTELDGSVFEVEDFTSVGLGGWSAIWDGSITREEFIQMVEDHTPPNATGNSGRSFRECYNKYFVSNAGNFYDICTRNGIDPRFVFCIGIHESAYGTSDIANTKMNFFGWGAYDDSPGESAITFTDISGGIEDVSAGLKQYVTPGTWQYERIEANGYDPTTIEGIGSLYASDPNWANAIKNYMTEIFGMTGSGLGSGNGNIVESARIVHQYVRTNGYTYEQVGVKVPNTSGRTIDCSSYVTWVLVEAGIPGFTSGMMQYTSATFAQNPQGWQTVSVEQAAPGDIVVYSGHVEIIAENSSGNKFRVYNCGGNSSINSSGTSELPESSVSGHNKSEAILILRVTNNNQEGESDE